jgi:hypothetical protein
MKFFWSTVFAPLTLLSNFATNLDAYWRRLQRILSHIDDDSEVPCPFSRPSQFLSTVGRIISKLDPNSLPQIVRCLERMPHANDSQLLLWSFPTACNNPVLFVRFLDDIHRTNHWLWLGLLNCASGSDVLLDRLLP